MRWTETFSSLNPYSDASLPKSYNYFDWTTISSQEDLERVDYPSDRTLNCAFWFYIRFDLVFYNSFGTSCSEFLGCKHDRKFIDVVGS